MDGKRGEQGGCRETGSGEEGRRYNKQAKRRTCKSVFFYVSMTDNPWPEKGFEHLAAGVAIFKALFYPSKH